MANQFNLIGEKAYILSSNGDVKEINKLISNKRLKKSFKIKAINNQLEFTDLKIISISKQLKNSNFIIIKSEKGRKNTYLIEQNALSYNGKNIISTPVKTLKPIDNIVIPKKLPVQKNTQIIFDILSILENHYLSND